MLKRLFILLICFLSYAPFAYSTTKIVVFGDSLVAGYGLVPKESLPAQLEAKLIADGYDVIVTNAGVSGDTTFGGYHRIRSIAEFRPDLVIIILGGNDMLRAIPPYKVRDNLQRIILCLKDQNIGAMLTKIEASVNVGPEYAKEFNSIYPDLAEIHGITLLPFILEGMYADTNLVQKDGLHPNAKGYAKIVEKIAPMVEAEIQKLSKD